MNRQELSLNSQQGYAERLRRAVSFAWHVLSLKISGGEIKVSREASLQLHFAVILQQILPLVALRRAEHAEVHLEYPAAVFGRPHEIDVFVVGRVDDAVIVRIAIEMKCYRVLAAGGGKRGATDIFMKDVYEDLAALERYCHAQVADIGVALVMNDHPYFVTPSQKKGKCWAYDISHDTAVGGGMKLDVPIGGHAVDITLDRQYRFLWQEYGGLFFAELEGHAIEPEALSAGG